MKNSFIEKHYGKGRMIDNTVPMGKDGPIMAGEPTMGARDSGGCDSCACVCINGHKCHEYGCPDAWMDMLRDCKWCGIEFKPESSCQTCCDSQCYSYWMGYE